MKKQMTASEMGRRGGRARHEKLTAERKQQIAAMGGRTTAQRRREQAKGDNANNT